MESLELNIRITHPVFGKGTVEHVTRRDMLPDLVHVRFDDDGVVRQFHATSEKLVADLHEKVS